MAQLGCLFSPSNFLWLHALDEPKSMQYVLNSSQHVDYIIGIYNEFSESQQTSKLSNVTHHSMCMMAAKLLHALY